MASFRRLFKYLGLYKTKVSLSVLFHLLTALFSTLSIALLWPFLTILFEKSPPVGEAPEWVFSLHGIIGWVKYRFYDFVGQAGQLKSLAIICGVIIFIFFLKNLFRYLATFVMTPVRNGIVYNIRKAIYSKILQLPVSYFTESRKGDIMSRTTSDLHEMEISILNMLQSIFREPLMIIFALGGMLIINVRLTFFVFALLLFTGFFIGTLAKTLKKRSRKAQEYLGELMNSLDETLTGLPIIKAFNAEKSQESHFDKKNSAYFRNMNKIMWRKDLSSPLSEFLGISVFVVLLWLGAQMVFNQKLDAPTFFVFLGLFQQIINPAKTFSSAYYNIQKGLAAADRIEELLNSEERIPESSKPIPIEKFAESLEFDRVSFAYEDQHEVLKDLSFRLEIGKTLALVGASGGGKTTLVDLIPRFHDVQSGRILLDGIDIRKYNLKDLRSLIGIVTQEPVLFHDTIFNNIAFGLEGVSHEMVIEAAKVANAHDFIMETAQGYDSLIGERGEKLSGGQRQRLTIARAVLRNPQILILDEATSSLDSVSEKLVKEALYKLMENRTSIVIAHRLSTIRHADEILVIEDGIIIERGTHRGLMKKAGAYQKLVELQAF